MILQKVYGSKLISRYYIRKDKKSLLECLFPLYMLRLKKTGCLLLKSLLPIKSES